MVVEGCSDIVSRQQQQRATTTTKTQWYSGWCKVQTAQFLLFAVVVVSRADDDKGRDVRTNGRCMLRLATSDLDRQALLQTFS
jgi:hypothetical protein